MAPAQQLAATVRPIRSMVILLLLVLATLLAGPNGFVVAAVLILGWAVVTGSLRLVAELVLLPFRIIGALARGGR
jgi:hypothetical protein